MEKCPFWSSKNNIFHCNEECPMHQFEGPCKFQMLFNLEFIEPVNELEELEYINN